MENTVWKKALINTLAATGSNVGLEAASGGKPALVYICSNDVSDGTAAYTIDATINNILPPIPTANVTKIVKTSAVAEVTQIGIIGVDTEVILVDTRYKVMIGNPIDKYEGRTIKEPFVYAYTSPAASGGVAVDRLNVYSALNNKINNHLTNKVTSYLMYEVAFTGGTSAGDAALNFTIGETVTQETSGITAKVAGCWITGGTMAGDDAAGFVYLYDFSAIASWDTGTKTLTGGTSALVVTGTAITTANAIMGLVITDDAGYYPANPGSRKGPSWIGVGETFTVAHVDVGVLTATTNAIALGRDGVVSEGIGTRMLTDVPAFTVDKQDYVSGDPAFYTNEVPVAGTLYTRYDIHLNAPAVFDSYKGKAETAGVVYTLWASETNGTNLTALETAFTEAIGVTAT